MSGKKDKSGNRTKSTATVPDIDLWERYTRTIQPVQRPDQPVPPAEKPSRESFAALLDAKAVRTEPKKPSQLEDTPLRPLTQREVKRPANTEPTAKAVPAPSNVDPHLLRRTKRGGGVDARIDLHGMRRDEAYHALLGFLADCHRKRLKLVLVITGKGMNSKQAQDWWDMPERGVLKRLVPQWLSQPAFGRLVSGYGPAGRADGGEGALYVQIRNPRRTPGLPGASL